MKVIELKPIEEPRDYVDALEARLKKFFRDHLYYPLLKELGLSRATVKNASHSNPLMDALYRGQITYSRGTFSGQLNAEISKELRAIGAKFDRKTSSYKLPSSELPIEVKAAISSGKAHMAEQMVKIDEKLAAFVPEELAAQFKCEDIFDKTLWKAEKSFQKNVKNITVAPILTDSQRKRIAEEWQDNMNLWIKGWTEEQIKSMRKKLFEDVMSGKRREAHVTPILKITQTIQDSHEEALHKAKFLAHQESRLLMAQYKKVRYTDAGSKSYIWRCVHRPHDSSPKQHTPGNVRYSHGLLDGKEFEWDNPPITTNPGQPSKRNNPGQDYNCRCFARPLLRVNRE